LTIVQPETLIRWHRRAFQLFWRWKPKPGRPRLPRNIRELIAQMARENPTWGQGRVASELSMKLGIYVSPRTIRSYWPLGSCAPRGGTAALAHVARLAFGTVIAFATGGFERFKPL
jgi:hypothetical protein